MLSCAFGNNQIYQQWTDCYVKAMNRSQTRSLFHNGYGKVVRQQQVQCTLEEFMILQKFELYKVQLTHGANHLYIHGNEKLNCLGSTGTSRSQIKSFTVCFLYANSYCWLRSPCKWYNSIRTLPGTQLQCLGVQQTGLVHHCHGEVDGDDSHIIGHLPDQPGCRYRIYIYIYAV